MQLNPLLQESEAPCGKAHVHPWTAQASEADIWAHGTGMPSQMAPELRSTPTMEHPAGQDRPPVLLSQLLGVPEH